MALMMLTEIEKKEACARIAHEANRTYCMAIGDQSQKSWEDSPIWQRESCRSGVDRVLAGKTPRQLHESWFADKRDAGWTYGPVKDPVKKQHPCMVIYDRLPPEHRLKDVLFVEVVAGAANALGLPVRLVRGRSVV